MTDFALNDPVIVSEDGIRHAARIVGVMRGVPAFDIKTDEEPPRILLNVAGRRLTREEPA